VSKLQVGFITSRLLEQLNAIDALPDDVDAPKRHACQVRLRNGRVLPRVVMIECQSDMNLGFDSVIGSSEILEWAGKGRAVTEEELFQAAGRECVDIEAVDAIEHSEERTPLPIYKKLRDAGETGMGYCIFALQLSDGRSLKCFSGGEFEFLQLPPGATARMIVDATPLGRDASNVDCGDAKAHWCFYRRSTGWC
jgi:hypothetical protein